MALLHRANSSNQRCTALGNSGHVLSRPRTDTTRLKAQSLTTSLLLRPSTRWNGRWEGFLQPCVMTLRMAEVDDRIRWSACRSKLLESTGHFISRCQGPLNRVLWMTRGGISCLCVHINDLCARRVAGGHPCSAIRWYSTPTGSCLWRRHVMPVTLHTRTMTQNHSMALSECILPCSHAQPVRGEPRHKACS